MSILNYALLLSLMQTIHPVQPDFDSAKAAARCVEEIAESTQRYVSDELNDRGLKPLRFIKPVVEAPSYTERFPGYGGHLYFSLKYAVLVETREGNGVVAVEVPILTTSQETQTYSFLYKGQAAFNRSRKLWAVASMPRIDGFRPAYAGKAQEAFQKAHACEVVAPIMTKVVSEFPRCLDPAEKCSNFED